MNNGKMMERRYAFFGCCSSTTFTVTLNNRNRFVWKMKEFFCFLALTTTDFRTIPLKELMMPDTLTILDNRTGKKYEVPIDHDTIRATDLRQIKVKDDDFGMMTYDPAFMNTAAVKSRITYIDGDKGILRYRGYPIEQLAENSTSFLEVAYLLLHGELPN